MGKETPGTEIQSHQRYCPEPDADTGYPNPSRVGCPGQRAVGNLPRFTGDIKELDTQYNHEHVTHCSPCYRECLDARQELRDAEEGLPVPKRVQQTEIARRLDGLEKTMKSGERELRRG